MIVDYLQQKNSCTYEALAQLFGISTMTIRRDVEKLLQQGAVIKTLGGVQKAIDWSSNSLELSLIARISMQRRQKIAIAHMALRLVEAKKTIFIDGSTTCLEFAKLIGREKKDVTIVTNSIMVCHSVGQNSNNLIIGLGGIYSPENFSFIGSSCEEEAAKYFVDIAFFSTTGFLPMEGMYESFFPTMRIKQIIGGHANKIVLLVDHTKFGRRALLKGFDISKIQEIITDDSVPPAFIRLLRKKGKSVFIADTNEKENRIS